MTGPGKVSVLDAQAGPTKLTRQPGPVCTCPKDPFGQSLWFEYWDGITRAEKVRDEDCPLHGWWAS